jgi:hypothetical protein
MPDHLGDDQRKVKDDGVKEDNIKGFDILNSKFLIQSKKKIPSIVF